MSHLRPVAAIFLLSLGVTPARALPEGFVYLDKVDPTIVVELRYTTANNFVGKRIDGYRKNRAILTRQAAEALAKAHAELTAAGYGIKIFDAYRPQRAVDHFVRWGRDLKDRKTKEKYYPDVPKSELFRRGYIASYSGHSRGSTVDVTLVEWNQGKPGKELDMGTPFDFFDTKSWPTSTAVTEEQKANRWRLRMALSRHGFRPYDREWWHFTLRNEPFARSYFNFPVE